MTLLSLGIAWILLQGAAQTSAISTLGPTDERLTSDDLTRIGQLARGGGSRCCKLTIWW